MTRKILLGKLPLIKIGPNKNRLDRKKTCLIYNFSYAQINKAYNNWIQIFRKEGSLLTFEQYLDKLRLDNLTPDSLGNKMSDYHLCRLNDEGGYTNENCQFKLARENFEEQIKNGKHHWFR